MMSVFASGGQPLEWSKLLCVQTDPYLAHETILDMDSLYLVNRVLPQCQMFYMVCEGVKPGNKRNKKVKTSRDINFYYMQLSDNRQTQQFTHQHMRTHYKNKHINKYSNTSSTPTKVHT